MKKFFIIITILGILLRFYVMWEFYLPYNVSDEKTYVAIAKHIVNDGQFIYTTQDDPYNWTNIIYAAKPPLYSYFLAALFRIFGIDSLLAKIIQISMSAGAALLLYKIGKKLASKRVGIICFILYTFFWPLVSISRTFYSENLFLPLVVLFIYAIVFWENHKKLFPVIIGVMLGLLILTRPQSSLFVGSFTLWFLWGKLNLKRIATLLLIYLFCAITLLPWTVRNYLIYNTFVPYTTGGGLDMWMGNFPESTGGYNLPVADNPNQTPKLLLKGPLREVERDRFYYTQSFIFMKNYPVETLDLMVRKFLLIFTIDRTDALNKVLNYGNWIFSEAAKSHTAFQYLQYIAIVEFVGMQILSFAGIIAIILMERVNRQIWLLFLLLATYIFSLMVAHVEGRYIYALYPFLIFFAAVTIDAFLRATKDTLRRKLLKS